MSLELDAGASECAVANGKSKLGLFVTVPRQSCMSTLTPVLLWWVNPRDEVKI